MPREFVLWGDTAIALQLARRASFDFDFFSQTEFDPDALLGQLPFLKAAKTLQKMANTLTCLVDRGRPIQVSFFGVPAIRLIRSPHVASDIGIYIASLLDLGGMKAAVVQKRAEAKDYIDIDALLRHGEVDLQSALAAGSALPA